MGTDAKLYSTKTKKSFYYDREYTLVNIATSDYIDKDLFTKGEGVEKAKLLELVQYLCTLSYTVFHHSNQEGVYERILAYLELLPDDDIIFSRNTSDDFYYDEEEYERAEIKFIKRPKRF